MVELRDGLFDFIGQQAGRIAADFDLVVVACLVVDDFDVECLQCGGGIRWLIIRS